MAAQSQAQSTSTSSQLPLPLQTAPSSPRRKSTTDAPPAFEQSSSSLLKLAKQVISLKRKNAGVAPVPSTALSSPPQNSRSASAPAVPLAMSARAKQSEQSIQEKKSASNSTDAAPIASENKAAAASSSSKGSSASVSRSNSDSSPSTSASTAGTTPSPTGSFFDEEKLFERVSKPARQRVRWTCDHCSTLFDEGRRMCKSCGHFRCETCLRDPPKRKSPSDPTIDDLKHLQGRLAAITICEVSGTPARDEPLQPMNLRSIGGMGRAGGAAAAATVPVVSVA